MGRLRLRDFVGAAASSRLRLRLGSPRLTPTATPPTTAVRSAYSEVRPNSTRKIVIM